MVEWTKERVKEKETGNQREKRENLSEKEFVVTINTTSTWHMMMEWVPLSFYSFSPSLSLSLYALPFFVSLDSVTEKIPRPTIDLKYYMYE